MDMQPTEIELEFGVKLEAGTGDIVSWIITNARGEAAMTVKLKWEKEK